MDFKQLESFVAVTKYKSFTRAAQELYLTQPTVTGHIRSMEEELGTILFNRGGKTITLTQAGNILYNNAVNILNMREQALYSMSRYQGRLEGELAIAASTVPQKYILPGLLADFSRKYPGIKYVIKQYDSRGVIDAICSGGMDFGFVGTSASYPELEMLKLCEDRLILITADKGKLQDFKDNFVTWDRIMDERFILREEGSGTRSLFINSLKKRGIDVKDLNVIASIENPDTVKQCVIQGLGVAVVSERSVAQEMELGLIKGFYISDLNLKRKFYFISHKNRVLSPVTRAFREFTAEYSKVL